MKKTLLLSILAACISTCSLPGQNVAKATNTLEYLFGRLKSVSDDSVRIRINDSIKVIVEYYVRSDSVFGHAYRGVKSLGQISSPDSRIRIITWNLVLNNGKGWYFCYLVKRNSRGKEKSVFRLEKKYSPEAVNTDTTYTASDWYGALYYDIRPFSYKGRQLWVLLGINYGDTLITRKVIDVLSFTTSNTPVFGWKWFKTGKGIYYRYILKYASNGVISLRFSSSRSIVFDHLVPVPPLANDGRIYYGSDYSFDSFTYRDGVWTLATNIDVRNKKK